MERNIFTFEEVGKLCDTIEVPKIIKRFHSRMRIHNTGRNDKGSSELLDLNKLSNDLKQTKEYANKPNGFWYGFGRSWHNWCKSEMPDWIGDVDYKVILPKNIKLMKMSSPNELIKFTNEYKLEEYEENFVHYIDWRRLANDYDGIEINPYISSMRLNNYTSWYYSWDVASGCIWNTSKIKVELL